MLESLDIMKLWADAQNTFVDEMHYVTFIDNIWRVVIIYAWHIVYVPPYRKLVYFDTSVYSFPGI